MIHLCLLALDNTEYLQIFLFSPCALITHKTCRIFYALMLQLPQFLIVVSELKFDHYLEDFVSQHQQQNQQSSQFAETGLFFFLWGSQGQQQQRQRRRESDRKGWRSEQQRVNLRCCLFGIYYANEMQSTTHSKCCYSH